MLQCEVSPYYAKGTSFLFPETEVLLDELFEPNETVLLRNIPYSPPDLVKKFFVSDSLSAEEYDQYHSFFFLLLKSICLCFIELGERNFMLCIFWGIIMETPGLIPPVTIESSKERYAQLVLSKVTDVCLISRQTGRQTVGRNRRFEPFPLQRIHTLE
jgi:hypothetical protein